MFFSFTLAIRLAVCIHTCRTASWKQMQYPMSQLSGSDVECDARACTERSPAE